MKISEIQELLNGCEVRSISMEGLVGCNRNKWFQNGTEIFPTDKQISKLWKEYLKDELG